MSKNNLTVKISKKTKGGVESWEGTVALPGVKPTKLTKAKTDDIQFNTRSALTSAAQRLATRYGFSEVEFEGAGSEKKERKTESKPRRSTKKVTTETEAPASL